jgi:hypothetical protein
VAGPEFSFSPLDLAIIGLYAAVILGKGIWLARARADTAEDYFLAGRNVVNQGDLAIEGQAAAFRSTP